MIRNQNIDRDWTTLFVPAVDFSSVRTPTVTPAIASAINTNEALSINSTGIFGVKMNTNGDTIRHAMMLPRSVDYSQPIHLRVHWTSGSATTADTIVWKVFTQDVRSNVDLLTATIARPLTTAIPQDTVPVATAYTLCRTEKGTIAPVDTRVTSGSNGVTTSATATSHTFTSAGATFSATGVITGDFITIAGTEYVVVSSSTATLVFAKRDGSSFDPGAATALSFSIRHPGISAGEFIELALEMDAKAVGLSEDIFAVGVEILYVPRLSTGVYADRTPALPSGW